MLKSFKNLVLYDIPPTENKFLNDPKAYLKKVLFDSESSAEIRKNYTNYKNSDWNTKESSAKSSSISSVSSSVTTTSSSTSSSLQIVDDGHELGLGNPKMLKLILSYLSIPDLLVARLVNLRWNVTACFILRSKLPIIKFPPSKLRSFRKLMLKNITNPIASYAIRIDNLWDKATYKFLTRFATEIYNLRVRLNISEFTEFAKILQKMKNLQALRLIIHNDDTDNKSHLLLHENIFSWDNGYFDGKGAWKLGLYKFTRLTKLIFENSDSSFAIHPFYDKIVTSIILASSQLAEISFIGWNTPIGKTFSKFGITKPGVLDTFGKGATEEEIVNLFFTSNLQFYKIRMEVTPQVSFELVTDVIHKCSETIHELSLGNENIFEKFSITSSLNNLVRLRLNAWSGPVDFTYFSRQFPALRHLSLNLSNLFEVENGLVDVDCIEPCIELKTITLMRLEFSGIDAPLLKKIARIFPNILELFIEIKDGAALETIYEVYPDLTLLCLELKCMEVENEEEFYKPRPPLMTNQSFTGIPNESLKILKERECGCPIIEFPEEIKGCWNIGCLKNLTTLLLRVPNTVDNIALLEGIARLSNLENLVLLPFYNHDEEPTMWCLRSIADNFPKLKTLVTSTEIQYLESDIHYLFSKLPKLIHKKKP